MNRFIEQLPGILAAPAQLDLVAGDDTALWRIMVMLAPEDQAALDALHPSASQLCAAAQHALGLAALGSRIDAAHTIVRVRVEGELLLAFVGTAALWWVANAPPTELRASIDRLLGVISERSVAHRSSSDALTTWPTVAAASLWLAEHTLPAVLQSGADRELQR
jgi:hypothetical protein